MAQDYYVCPKQAGKKWKMAHAMNKTVYIYGVAGAGKTVFVTNQLKNKKYLYLSGKNAVEENFIIPKQTQKLIVVVDDLQYMEVRCRDALLRLVEREDIWLVICGRSKLPRYMTSLYIRCEFIVITEEDLRLSMEELRKYFSLWEIALNSEILSKIYADIMGNGLVSRMVALELASGSIYSEQLLERVRVQLMNYMEREAYDTWDIIIQDFFMQVSIVDSFDEKLAEMITGRKDVVRILEDSMELGNFLEEKNGIFAMKRSMLLSMRRRQKRNYSTQKIARLYYNAGLYYELHDQINEALHMYELGGHQDRISELLIHNARENPASGYYYELKDYYLELPESYILESVELMAGMSMLQALLLNSEESERWYQELVKYEKNVEGSKKKAAKNMLLYLDIGLPQRGSKDLIDIFKHAFPLVVNRSIALPEFSVTSNLPSLMNGGKDFCDWSRKDRYLADTIGKILESILGKYGKGLISIALAESFFEKGTDSYEVSVYANRGRMEAEAGGKIENEFVAVGILARLHVINGHIDVAKDILSSFRQRAEEKKVASAMIQNIDAMEARVACYMADLECVSAWQDTAPDEGKEFYALNRYQYLTKIRAYLMEGENEKAITLCHKLLYYAEMMKRTYVRIEANLLLAIAMYRRKDLKWKHVMTSVLTEASGYHFVRLISREGAAAYPLMKELNTGREAPNNPDFWKEVCEETKKMALLYPSYLKVQKPADVQLSEHARRILCLQAEGKSARQIAKEIGIAEDTVRYHSKQTYRKLGVRDKAAAVLEAKRRGII